MANRITQSKRGLGRRTSEIFDTVIDTGGGEAVFNLVVSRMLYAIVPLCAIWLACSVSRAAESGWHPIYTLEIISGTVVFICFLCRKFLPLRFVAISFLTFLAFLSTIGLLSFGLAAAGAMMGLVGVSVLAVVIYGKKGGVIAFFFGLAVLGIVAVGVHFEALPFYAESLHAYVRTATAWITAAADLSLIAVVLILCISAIQERLLAAAQSAQIESEFTDMALNAQQDMFFVFNLHTRKVLRWNKAFREITGLSDQEIAARPIPDGFADLVDLPEVLAALDRLSGGSKRYFETEIRSVDGRRVPMEFRGVIAHRPALGGTLVIGVGRDMTTRREAEQALRESEERFRLITDNISTVVWTFGADGNPTYISSNIEKVCGYTPSEIIDGGRKFWFSRIHDEDKDLYIAGDSDVFGKRANADLKYRLRNKDGKIIWIHHQAAPVAGKDGSVSACGVWSDITEQVNTVQELHQAEKMQAVGRLAGGIAHDFNNQIMAVSGCAELLAKETANNPRLYEYVNHIRACAGFAASLTDQLLAFSRKTVGRDCPQDAHRLIHQTVAILERSIPKHIRISQTEEATNAIVSVDLPMLQNALLNLCLNARDAMPGGGEMTISTRNVHIPAQGDPSLPSLSAGSYLCIEVADTGCGMDTETQEKIFEPFFTTKPEGKGTGLGLAGVMNFVKNRHGTVRVSSTLDEGTAVSLYLPTVSPTWDARTKDKPHEDEKRCILLVDDDVEVSKTIADMLEEFGYRVERFDNGRGAIDRYRRNPADVDLVILDWVMPDLSGKETFSALRAMNENLKVLLASARVTPDEVKRVLADGAAGYIEKPFSAEELAHKIGAALQSN